MGGWGKNQKKFMQGCMPRKKIRAKTKIKKKIHAEGKSNCDFYLRWLKAVSSTFQDVDFDVSLLPLVIT